MLVIENMQMLNAYLRNNEYDIRNVFECNGYDAIYFNLVALYQSHDCYSEDPEVIDYVLSAY